MKEGAAQRGSKSIGGRKADDRTTRAGNGVGGGRHRRAEEGPGCERPGLEVERTPTANLCRGGLWPLQA